MNLLNIRWLKAGRCAAELVLSGAVLACLGCSDVAGVGVIVDPLADGSPAHTDAGSYQLHRTTNAYEATAIVTYVNRTDATIRYARCGTGSYDGPLYSVRRTGPDSTRKLWTDIGWACAGHVPTGTIPPRDSVTVTVRLGAYDQPTMSPPIQPEDLVGLMRVEFVLCAEDRADSDACASSPLPQNVRVSNPFLVRY